MTLGDLRIAVNGLPLAPIGNDIRVIAQFYSSSVKMPHHLSSLSNMMDI